MPSNHLLRKAAQDGDASKVLARLDAGDEREGRHKGTGRTPLLEAAIAGHGEIVTILLDRGAEIGASCTAVGNTALGWAASLGHLDIVAVLLDRGVDPDEVPSNSFLGRTPLMLAAMDGFTDVLRLLLESGADPALADNRGDNALSLARDRRQDAAAEVLLAAGATSPTPPEEPPTIPWPALPWRPDDPRRWTDPLPDEATPAQVVRSYVLAVSAWETDAWEASRAAHAADERYDLKAALDVAHLIRDVHCTAKRRAYSRASISALPDLTADVQRVGHTEPTSSRTELLLRYLDRTLFQHGYEWSFVCLRKGGRWRIDSAKHRLVGTEKWRPYIL